MKGIPKGLDCGWCFVSGCLWLKQCVVADVFSDNSLEQLLILYLIDDGLCLCWAYIHLKGISRCVQSEHDTELSNAFSGKYLSLPHPNSNTDEWKACYIMTLFAVWMGIYINPRKLINPEKGTEISELLEGKQTNQNHDVTCYCLRIYCAFSFLCCMKSIIANEK